MGEGQLLGENLLHVAQEINAAHGRRDGVSARHLTVDGEEVVGGLLNKHVVVTLVGAVGIVVITEDSQLVHGEVSMTSTGLSALLDGVYCIIWEVFFEKGETQGKKAAWKK